MIETENNERIDQVKLSIIICTIKEGIHVYNLIDSILLHETPAKYVEFIFVLQGFEQTNEIEIAWLLDFKKFNYKVVFDDGRGAARARNIGFKEASGKFISFWDDDIILFKPIIHPIISVFEVEKKVCFTGNEIYHFTEPIPPWYPLNDINRDKNLIVFLHGSLMCFTQDLLLKMGLFPEFLGPGSGNLTFGEETFIERKIRKKLIPVNRIRNLEFYHLRNKLLTYKEFCFSSFKRGFCHLIIKYSFEDLSIRFFISMVSHLISYSILLFAYILCGFFTFFYVNKFTQKSSYCSYQLLNYLGSFYGYFYVLFNSELRENIRVFLEKK